MCSSKELKNDCWKSRVEGSGAPVFRSWRRQCFINAFHRSRRLSTPLLWTWEKAIAAYWTAVARKTEEQLCWSPCRWHCRLWSWRQSINNDLTPVDQCRRHATFTDVVARPSGCRSVELTMSPSSVYDVVPVFVVFVLIASVGKTDTDARH